MSAVQSSKLREFITLEADTGVSHLSWQGEREGEGEIGDVKWGYQETRTNHMVCVQAFRFVYLFDCARKLPSPQS